MFGLLNKNTKRLHSFGQISKFEDGKYIISYKDTNIFIITNHKFDLGDWVLLYGKFKNDVLHVRYIEKLIAVDIFILEKIANFLEENEKNENNK
jgi:hypothetical protein